MLIQVVMNMDNQYPVVYQRGELERRPEEQLEEAAEVFRKIGQAALAVAAILGGAALLIRLFR